MRITIAWNGLPFYAASQLSYLTKHTNYDLDFIGTKPSVPIKGMDELLNNQITWIDPNIRLTWQSLNKETPTLFIHTGWAYPAFNYLADQVIHSGGKVVSIIDNVRNNTFRQFLGSVYFRLFLKKRFTALWVPGEASKKLSIYLGASDHQIFSGVYAADSSVFRYQVKISKRPKNILYVGQFIERKFVLELINAFNIFSNSYPDWTLTLVGSGPLKAQIPSSSNVVVKDFLQPDLLVKEYNNARVFVLASKEEHFGLVVHEATLCGCPLILGPNIGASYDLLNNINGIQYKSNSIDCITKSLIEFAGWPDNRLLEASEQSLNLSTQFGGTNFVKAFNDIVAYSCLPH